MSYAKKGWLTISHDLGIIVEKMHFELVIFILPSAPLSSIRIKLFCFGPSQMLPVALFDLS